MLFLVVLVVFNNSLRFRSPSGRLRLRTRSASIGFSTREWGSSLFLLNHKKNPQRVGAQLY